MCYIGCHVNIDNSFLFAENEVFVFQTCLIFSVSKQLWNTSTVLLHYVWNIQLSCLQD